MRIMISLFLLAFFAFLSAYIARQRGRDPIAWFMIGILLGIFSPILLLVMKPLQQGQEKDHGIEENEDSKLVPVHEPAKTYADKVWFYMDKSNLQQGPVYFSALKSLWRDEKITAATYVWSEGMAQWKRIRELPGFVEAF